MRMLGMVYIDIVQKQSRQAINTNKCISEWYKISEGQQRNPSQNILMLFFRSLFTIKYHQIMMQFRRKQEESKKDFYRRIAEVKKQTWAAQYHLQEQENYKAHFAAQEDDLHDLPKSKKIAKVQYRAEQRLRNRVAAQESRERHRSYVEELERKVSLYQMLLQKHGGICKNCKKPLGHEHTQTESMSSEPNCNPEESSKLPLDLASQEDLLNTYLDDQMVRIDNQGATSPFSIFFILCLVGVLAIFTLQSANPGIAPRLLTNYHSTLNQLISQQEMPPHENIKQQDLPLLLEPSSQLGGGKPETSPTKESVAEQDRPEAGQLKGFVEEWTKYGKYMCGRPQVVLDKRGQKSRKGPEFLLLRTGKNTGKAEQKREVEGSSESENHNFKIVPRDWQRLQISSCFLGEM